MAVLRFALSVADARGEIRPSDIFRILPKINEARYMITRRMCAGSPN